MTEKHPAVVISDADYVCTGEIVRRRSLANPPGPSVHIAHDQQGSENMPLSFAESAVGCVANP